MLSPVDGPAPLAERLHDGRQAVPLLRRAARRPAPRRHREAARERRPEVPRQQRRHLPGPSRRSDRLPAPRRQPGCGGSREPARAPVVTWMADHASPHGRQTAGATGINSGADAQQDRPSHHSCQLARAMRARLVARHVRPAAAQQHAPPRHQVRHALKGHLRPRGGAELPHLCGFTALVMCRSTVPLSYDKPRRRSRPPPHVSRQQDKVLDLRRECSGRHAQKQRRSAGGGASGPRARARAP